MISKELQQEALDLLAKVEATAKEEGRKEALSECADQLAEQQARFDAQLAKERQAAYQQGYQDALKANPQSPATPESDHSDHSEYSDPSTPASPSQPSLAAEFPLTNPRVAAFIAHRYPENILSSGKSVVDDYIVKHVKEGDYPNNAVEHPLPVTLGTPDDDAYLKGGGHVYQGKAGQIYNLVPNRTYEGTIAGNPVKFDTTGTVRQIHFDDIDHISNCRDIGGYPCQGGSVRYGRIIRSAYLPKTLSVGSPNVKILKGLGVTCEIDLRGESARNDLGWRGYAISLNGYAQAITAPKGYKDVFTRILKEVKQSGCVIIHCHAGADRTGTLVALILALLGVSASDICHDYELTSACSWCNFKRISDERFTEFPKGELRSTFIALAKLYGTKGESLQQQATSWWTKKVGITATQISELRSALILPS